ncbi:alpha/beta fold hydrolase [Mycobacteroides franklinii]|uniref:Haloalkane dehalogenase n=1 Tax=Mycobacteroides franklinii TaxID=948102 RepID=A0A4R8QXP5_9MYCO|nr:alpha/beta hydrolase [Mycobacteroides franklinii]TDZ45165.1 Haloalkane dehalogenase [Mycobacteroides franklinii]TDZ48655.1 Haloalkane dehalogenase [Mycobacteroides franklinii]TDZ58836.1 Haloalkane dehalogenase [Mycobacteroides franklinii]TDZ66351.1 Haloalkane dehalogenase [Mycobacteroides franklinii]TDZ72274.1 Haloalkane dehalogenase [Mycobacteroides franklinii]
MAEIRTSEVIVDGVRSPLLATGPDHDSTAVVFIHGNPGSSHDFRGLLATVGDHTRAVALDMPGFGQADKPRNFSQSAVGHARHLDGALAKLAISDVHLVLHDFGGLWGLTWAAAHLEQVASITLMNTGAISEHRWHWPARLWLVRGIGELVMRLTTTAAFKLIIQHGYALKPWPTPLPADFLAHMAHDFDAETRDAVLHLYRASRNMGEFGPALAYLLRQHAIPALVIWGARDHFLPVKHAHQQLDAFPSAEVVILDKAGHFPMISHPAQTEAAVTRFLKPLLAQAQAPAPRLDAEQIQPAR